MIRPLTLATVTLSSALLLGCNSSDTSSLLDNALTDETKLSQQLCEQETQRLTGFTLTPTIDTVDNIGVKRELVDGYYPVAQSGLSFVMEPQSSSGQLADNCVPRTENPVSFDAWQLVFDTPITVNGRTLPADTNLQSVQSFDGGFQNVSVSTLSPDALGQVTLDESFVLPVGEHQMTLSWTSSEGEQFSSTVPLRVE